MTWNTVCKADELAVGHMAVHQAGSARVLLHRLSDGYFATQTNCTHTFAPLSRGKIVDGCVLQCPLHRARFDIKTGQVVQWANFPPGIQLLNAVRGEKPLKTYAVRVKQGVVQVQTD